jgi:hypothetical protein
LLELKCYEKAVGVEEALVLAARRLDIADANKGHDVVAILLSTKNPSRNVPPLCRHFGLKLDIVEDALSYGLSFADSHFIGHVERAHAVDVQDAVVVRGGN